MAASSVLAGIAYLHELDIVQPVLKAAKVAKAKAAEERMPLQINVFLLLDDLRAQNSIAGAQDLPRHTLALRQSHRCTTHLLCKQVCHTGFYARCQDCCRQRVRLCTSACRLRTKSDSWKNGI